MADPYPHETLPPLSLPQYPHGLFQAYFVFGGIPVLLREPPPARGEEELDRRGRCLFGAEYPFTKEGNRLAHLYDEAGTTLTFASPSDLRLVAETVLDGVLHALPFPCSVELNVAWSLGAPGQVEADEYKVSHVAFALFHQMFPGNPLDEQGHCRFSACCRPDDERRDREYVRERAAHRQSTTPLFRVPRIVTSKAKAAEVVDEETRSLAQSWRPYQFCTNCIAGRAKWGCTLYESSSRWRVVPSVAFTRPGEATPGVHKSREDDRFGALLLRQLGAQDWGYFRQAGAGAGAFLSGLE